jgi:hypothetical protein
MKAEQQQQQHQHAAAADKDVRLEEMFIEEYAAPLTLTIDIEEGAILEREDTDEFDDRPTIEQPAWTSRKRSKSRAIGLVAIAGALTLGILAWALHARKPSGWFARLGFAS